MWCSTCQQDVPGIADRDLGNRICCARCRSSLLRSDPAGESETPEPAASVASDALPTLDDWSLQADLSAVTQMMGALRRDPARCASTRIDLPHLAPAASDAAHMPPAAQSGRGGALAPPRAVNWLVWPALMLGMMSFTCGAVLLGWSLVTARGDLWALGMPVVLAGQALLVVGLILQLDGLWRHQSEARATLAALDQQLSELRQATTLLAAAPASPGQAFYAHLADGASADLLLADVKGQLDVIALRLAQAKTR